MSEDIPGFLAKEETGYFSLRSLLLKLARQFSLSLLVIHSSEEVSLNAFMKTWAMTDLAFAKCMGVSGVVVMVPLQWSF